MSRSGHLAVALAATVALVVGLSLGSAALRHAAQSGQPGGHSHGGAAPMQDNDHDDHATGGMNTSNAPATQAGSGNGAHEKSGHEHGAGGHTH